MRVRFAIAFAVLATICLVACGNDPEPPPPPGPLADALAEIGGGGENGSLGVGWTEPKLARQAGWARD